MADFPFNIDEADPNSPALTAGGRTYTYGELVTDVITKAEEVSKKTIFFCTDDKPYESIVTYLACLKAKVCVGIMPKGMDMASLDDFRALMMKARPALIISTSGSTGSKKFVKLTLANVMANCEAICKSLPIQQSDIAGLMLPISYSYGLSVINTHLFKHAHICVMTTPFGSKVFWKELTDKKITSLALVPSHLVALKLGFFEMSLPKVLRYITLAGGALDRGGLLKIEAVIQRGPAAYVMYGQTEATARITCLPSEMFKTKRGSVGKPIAGELSLDPETQEIIYDGPNVSMGYATTPQELYVWTERTRLRTGDIGRLDADGYLWITGRLKRIAKINSQRVSLDELERILSDRHDDVIIKCVSDDKLVYCCSTEDIPRPNDMLVGSIVMVKLEEFPMTSTGKTDYVKLLEAACSRS